MLKVELAALVPVSSDLLAAQAFRRLGTVTGGLHLGTGYARNVGNTEFWVRGTVCDSGVTVCDSGVAGALRTSWPVYTKA